MLDLSADNRVHRVLVPIPILTAPIDHSTVGTFNNVPKHTINTLMYNSNLCENINLNLLVSKLFIRNR